MAITSVGEAHAVADLIRLLLPVDRPGDSEKSRAALTLLAEGAYKKLKAGTRPSEVGDLWERRSIIERLAQSLYGDDTSALLTDLAQARQIAVSHLDRLWVEEHCGAELSDEQWALLVPKLARYDEEVSERWVRERVVDELLAEAGIDKHFPDVDLELDDPEPDPCSDPAPVAAEEDASETQEDEADERDTEESEESEEVDQPPAEDEVDELPDDEPEAEADPAPVE